LYDTQQASPLAYLSQLHYSTFTDLAWSPDGNSLFMTSTDGFGSLAIFEPGELGEPLTELDQVCQLTKVTEIAQEPENENDENAYKAPLQVEKSQAVHVVGEGIVKKRRIEPILISK
jgi:WD40 repeat protein